MGHLDFLPYLIHFTNSSHILFQPIFGTQVHLLNAYCMLYHKFVRFAPHSLWLSSDYVIRSFLWYGIWGSLIFLSCAFMYVVHSWPLVCCVFLHIHYYWTFVYPTYYNHHLLVVISWFMLYGLNGTLSFGCPYVISGLFSSVAFCLLLLYVLLGCDRCPLDMSPVSGDNWPCLCEPYVVWLVSVAHISLTYYSTMCPQSTTISLSSYCRPFGYNWRFFVSIIDLYQFVLPILMCYDYL